MDNALGSEHILVRVIQSQYVSADALQLILEPVERDNLPKWEAGAHVDLRLPSGLLRQYSLCSDVADTSTYTICVLKEPAGRGGSVEAHRLLTVGTEVTIQGPRNLFHLTPAPSYVFIAGGIGITPIKAMIYEAERRRAQWTLVYGGRNLDSMAFGKELADRFPDRVRLVPQDVVGLIDVGDALSAVDESTQVYCCGPAGLLGVVQAVCEERRFPDRLHFERFTAAPETPAPSTDDTAFEVELRQSGVVLQVASHQSILEVIQQLRNDVDFSCQEGYCGSCETRVLAGQPDHRGSLMTPEDHDEEGTMLICVGRSCSPRLVLDL